MFNKNLGLFPLYVMTHNILVVMDIGSIETLCKTNHFEDNKIRVA